MSNSMLSNQRLTLKSHIPISFGVGDTFKIFETGLDVVEGSIVFSNKVQLERLVVNIDTDGTCEIVMRGLDNTEIKNEDPSLKRDWDIGANGYITVFASDIFDKDSELPQTIKAPFAFEKEVTFQSDVNFENGFEVNGQSKPFPQVDDEIERDNMYPNPTGGEVAIVGGYIQIFNPETQQRETLDIGTPLPDATETIKGKIRIATDAEANEGIRDDVAITPNKMTKSLVESGSHLTEQLFMAGEDVEKNDSLFVEDRSIIRDPILYQNIGDKNSNKAFAFDLYGQHLTPGSSLGVLGYIKNIPSCGLKFGIYEDNLGTIGETLIDNGERIQNVTYKNMLVGSGNIANGTSGSKGNYDGVLLNFKEGFFLESFTGAATNTDGTFFVIHEILGELFSTSSFNSNQIKESSCNIFIPKGLVFIGKRKKYSDNDSIDKRYNAPNDLNLSNTVELVGGVVNTTPDNLFNENISKSRVYNVSSIKGVYFEDIIAIPSNVSIDGASKYWIKIEKEDLIIDDNNHFGIGYYGVSNPNEQTLILDYISGERTSIQDVYPIVNIITLKKTNTTNDLGYGKGVIRLSQKTSFYLQKCPVSFFGEHGGFVGLEKGKQYYLQDVPGAIGLVPGTHVVPVGVAINDSTILLGLYNDARIPGNTFIAPCQGMVSLYIEYESNSYCQAYLEVNGEIVAGAFAMNSYNPGSFSYIVNQGDNVSIITSGEANKITKRFIPISKL